jgi:hypothetical protein
MHIRGTKLKVRSLLLVLPQLATSIRSPVHLSSHQHSWCKSEKDATSHAKRSSYSVYAPCTNEGTLQPTT